jgi:3D (Asp-Asp-Asp) domain-containing protein
MKARLLCLLAAPLALCSTVSCSSTGDGSLAQVGDFRIVAYDGGSAEARSGSSEPRSSETATNAGTVAMRGPAREFVVKTTAYTHTEADSLQYGTKNAYGSNLKFGNNVRSAAADWSRYPVGTVFKIKGLPYNYVVDDYGSALVGTDTIDLYKPNHAEMNAWGARNVGIEVIQWGSFDKSLEILDGRKGKASHVDRMHSSIKSKINRVPIELRNGFRPS